MTFICTFANCNPELAYYKCYFSHSCLATYALMCIPTAFRRTLCSYLAESLLFFKLTHFHLLRMPKKDSKSLLRFVFKYAK